MPVTSDFGFTMRPSRRDLIVVAADDPAMRGELVTRLQEDGYSVVQASSGEEASATLGMTHASIVVAALRDAGALREVAVPVIYPTRSSDISDLVGAALAKRP
jgi:DNA-binding response OmpR family regulator